MMQHRAVLSILVTALALGACRREPAPAPAPTPTPSQPNQPPTTGSGQPAAGNGAAARAETERALAILQEMVFFDFDNFDIRPDAEATLMRKLPILRANGQVRLRLDGHADERGSLEYNQALAQRRANAVRAFLMSHGIDGSRLESISFGEERPLDPRSTEEAWARNRRAEFHVTAGADRITAPVSQ